MNVVVFASRKGGSGKSTLAAHLATFIHKPARPTLLIDADPQGSLTLWNDLRGDDRLVLRRPGRSLTDTLKAAKQNGYLWTLIDTPPNLSAVVTEAIRAAALVVIPTRPNLFDLAAVRDTIAMCRELRKPYAVVMNGAPAKRNGVEAPAVAEARAELNAAKVPVWSGQITHRSDYALALGTGEGAREFDAESLAAAELAGLWSAVDRSIKAINGIHQASRAMHKIAA
jgi:chromosome partitioning protein